MTQSAKILWGEGLFLRPQHLQMQDLYHEGQLSRTARLLNPFFYGVLEARFDESLLATGTLAFDRLALVWPSGEVYEAPGRDALPDPVVLDSTRLPDVVMAYMVSPVLNPAGDNISRPEQGTHGRYISAEVEGHDLYSHAAPADIAILRQKPRIILGDAATQLSGSAFPVLRLVRTPSGIYEVDREFVAPVVQTAASDFLLQMVQRLLGIMQSKMSTLYKTQSENNANVVEFRSSDVAAFWLLHTLNSSYAALLHVAQNPRLPPERLYQELCRLAGGLMTFSHAHSPKDLEQYNHDQLGEIFGRLENIIRDLLDTVISSRYLNIPLNQVRTGYMIGHLQSDKINPQTRLYLSVSSAAPAHEVVSTLPVRFKIGAPDDVEQRVIAALPGVPLTHVTQVPSAIPVRPGCIYFAIEPGSNLYEKLLASESVCIYTATGYPDLKLELMALV